MARLTFAYLRALALNEHDRRDTQSRVFERALTETGSLATVLREREGFKRLANMVTIFEEHETAILKLLPKKPAKGNADNAAKEPNGEDASNEQD